MRKRYKIPLPEGRGKVGEDYSAETHKQAMIGFAKFVYGNLNGQTSVRIDSSWASQAELIRGMKERYKGSLPLRWVAGATAVCLIGGFLLGLWWVDHRSRKRHGGIRIY